MRYENNTGRNLCINAVHHKPDQIITTQQETLKKETQEIKNLIAHKYITQITEEEK